MYTSAEWALLRATDPNPLPGVDTPVGNLTTPTKSVGSIPRVNTAPFWYYPAANVIYVRQAGVVLDGYNFGNTQIFVEANNVTIKNSTFSAGGSELSAVRGYG